MKYLLIVTTEDEKLITHLEHLVAALQNNDVPITLWSEKKPSSGD